ncbi:MAG: STAS domain-containing protein [Planctomycetes bacterium]|nr:STAS domain-containing protein [Planctomycetota bacterium]
MKIDKFVRDDHCILALKGEFDTFYVPSLQDEVQSLLDGGVTHVILNLRLVKFINSTALGAIIRMHKLCKAANGELVVAQPSAFVRNVIGKIGIDQLVPIYDEEDQAVKHVIKALNALELAGAAPVNQEKVMITFPDEIRNKQIGGVRTLLGTMGNVNGERIQFLFHGEKAGIPADKAKALFFKGSDLNLKFQVKMFKKGYFELLGKVSEVEDADDGGQRVTVRFVAISDSDRTALTQFAEDMEFLKRQLPR